MAKSASKLIGIRAPVDLIERLDAIGAASPIPATRSKVCLAALREYVEKHGKTAPTAKPKR
jgi:metal-responsive CopG/Arc/MetJ family transcriptional regulator